MMIRCLALSLFFSTTLASAGQVEEAQSAFDEKNFKRAFELISQAATSGNPEAQTKLGFLYMVGAGVDADPSAALKLFSAAALQDYDRAQHALCIVYAQGSGVTIDFAKAILWCEKSASRGNEVARTDLGLFYLRGMGVKKDLSKARDIFLIAAGNGEPRAQRNLAIMFSNGDAGYIDPIASKMWMGLSNTSPSTFCVQIEWCPKKPIVPH
jgi:TPR repeat protein